MVGLAIQNFEFFGVEVGVGAEQEFAEVLFFEVDDEFFVFVEQAVIDGWVDDDG